MKRIILLAACALLLAGCGVGVYSVSGGRADQAMVSFAIEGTRSVPVTVSVDGKSYNVNAIAGVSFKKNRNIKQTSKNTLLIEPGTHDVKVCNARGEEIFSKKLVISTGEHRVVEL